MKRENHETTPFLFQAHSARKSFLTSCFLTIYCMLPFCSYFLATGAYKYSMEMLQLLRSTNTPTSCKDCAYRFKSSCDPTFTISSRNSESILNLVPYDPIVTRDEINITQACNEVQVQVLDERTGLWSSSLTSHQKKDREIFKMRDLFHISYHHMILQRTMSTEAVNALAGKTIKMQLKCNNNINGCLLFHIQKARKQKKSKDGKDHSKDGRNHGRKDSKDRKDSRRNNGKFKTKKKRKFA